GRARLQEQGADARSARQPDHNARRERSGSQRNPVSCDCAAKCRLVIPSAKIENLDRLVGILQLIMLEAIRSLRGRILVDGKLPQALYLQSLPRITPVH